MDYHRLQPNLLEKSIYTIIQAIFGGGGHGQGGQAQGGQGQGGEGQGQPAGQGGYNDNQGYTDQQQQQQPQPCEGEMGQFVQCALNSADVTECTVYLDHLKQCRDRVMEQYKTM